MPVPDRQTALQALAWRRLLVTAWPWRSAGYLITTLPVALPAAALTLPWLVLAARLSAGEVGLGPTVGLIGLGCAIVVAVGPLLAVPLAAVERRRLRLVDHRPVRSGHHDVDRPKALAWPRTRYAEPATWREVAYTCLVGTVLPLTAITALLAMPLCGAMAVSPLLVLAQQPDEEPVAIGVATVATVEQAAPYAIVGALLLPLVPYLLTVLAGGHAAIARALVGGGREQLHAQLAEVSRSRARLVDAFEAERRRIERDLHDGAQQRLVSLTMQLGLARLDLPPSSPAEHAVASAHDQAKQLMSELRELIHGIRPQTLTDLGLPAAIEELADRSAIPVTVDVALAVRPPEHIERMTYFVVAEALSNVAKHSGATTATVTVRRQDHRLRVEIRDDGRGGADPGRGTGLTGLADRVAVAGGRLLLSSPPGGPTVLRVEVPA